MVIKNGFLLVELMIGLTLSTFFILITTHYIIELKKTQQIAMSRIEALSVARNAMERSLSGIHESSSNATIDNRFIVSETDQLIPIVHAAGNDETPFILKNIVVSWNAFSQRYSLHICGHTPMQKIS